MFVALALAPGRAAVGELGRPHDPSANRPTTRSSWTASDVNVVDPTARRSARPGRQFFLGADANGRDVVVRLLYGGRTSLFVRLGATLLTVVLALFVALPRGYLRGRVDAVVGRALDVLWAFPVILIAIALGAWRSTGRAASERELGASRC